jgi:putative tricarboxylic transport membrane protein
MILHDLAQALLYVMSPVPFLWVMLGTLSGVFVGAIPGLSGGMLIALAMPLTYGMNSTNALVMMIGIYVGSVSGGLVSATLLRMPGTPSSVMTTFDGYPMAQRGEAERALALGIGASLIGGLIAGVVLVFLSPPLSHWAMSFGPWEYCTMVLMAIVLIASLSQGSLVKGLMGGFLGMVFAIPGLSASDGQLRLTFGWHALDDGFNVLSVLLGVFVMSTIIKDAYEIRKAPAVLKLGNAKVLLGLAEWRRHWVNILRSAAIGTWAGILPGVGASISSMIAYATAKNLSKTPERFGTGHDEGIVASEAANNANVGGAIIPMITMGIPGSPTDAILIAAMVLHNIQPGPLLFTTNAHFTWALIAAYLVANVLMFLVMTLSIRPLARIITIPKAYLLPVIFVCCAVGAYAVNNRLWDIWVVIGFGVLGFFLDRAKVPLGPFVIGFVLAETFETQFRASLQISDHGWMGLFDRPIATVFFAVSVLMLLWPLAQEWRAGRRAAALRRA